MGSWCSHSYDLVQYLGIQVTVIVQAGHRFGMMIIVISSRRVRDGRK